MKLKEYLELKKEEQIQLIQLIEEHLRFDELKEISATRSITDINIYFAERMREREKITTIQWPEKLSKKETVICRLKMMQSMLSEAPAIDDDASAMKHVSVSLIKSVMQDVFSHKSTKDGPKWPGLDPAIAKVLNAIYNIVEKFYERKFKV